MARELVMGLDLGTTSVKAVLFTIEGRLISEAEEPVKTYYPRENWVEQNPKEIEQASRSALQKVLQKGRVKEKELLAIGISSAMHSIICLDERDEPLSNMLIWSDGRSSRQAEELLKTAGKEVYDRTGTPIHPMSPFVKLVWMKETHFEPYVRAARFMSMKEYLLSKWFGKRVIDYSMASATGLFNLQNYDWDMESLEIAGIQRNQLSEIVPPTYILTGMKKEIASEIGLNEDIPFVIGAADGQLANLGSGAISKGEVAITAGTSGAIRQFMDGRFISKRHDTFTYAFTKEKSIIGGPTNNGGIALQWLKDLLEDKGGYDEFQELAGNVSPGSNGLLFLPYINGERAPLWDRNAKGVFFGLTITHKKEHLVRAVLEGVSFNLYQIGKTLERLAGAPEKIYVNGGLARSDIWVQILADLFGKEIQLSATHHSSAWGAAWTALVAIGKASSFEGIKKYLHITRKIGPDMNMHDKYREIYEKYEGLVKDFSRRF